MTGLGWDERTIYAMDQGEARRQTAATGVLLVVLTLERLAYYALATSFLLFLNKGPWDGSEAWNTLEAMNAVFVLAAVSYMSALLGGYISDAWLGRFKTMVLGFLMYIGGYILLTLIANKQLPRQMCSFGQHCTLSSNTDCDGLIEMEDRAGAPCKTAVYVAITVVGLGVGTVKSNIAPFGAEQLRTGNPQRMRSFFNWFYWCINFGSLVGVSAISYIEQDCPGICSNGFYCGYLIATICLGVSLTLFVVFYPCYYCARPEGSIMGNVARIIWEATKAQVQHWRSPRPNNALNPLHLEPQFLDRAKVRYGGSFHESAVDDVRSLGKLFVVFIALIPYWLVYFQMDSSFQIQGLHMRFSFYSSNGTGPVGPSEGEFSVPAAWLTLFNQLFLVAAIPILTSLLYPRLDRAGIRVSMLFRIGLGMLFSLLAVMSAGGLESYRTYLWRNDNSTHIEQLVGNVTYNAVNISIFLQVPQYMLVGAAEAFASIAGLEFAYSAAPRTFQGMIMGLFYTMEGIGSLLGTVLLQAVGPFWFSNKTDFGNINDNHMDFYLYFLGVIQFITLCIYCVTLYMQRFSLQPLALPQTPGDSSTSVGGRFYVDPAQDCERNPMTDSIEEEEEENEEEEEREEEHNLPSSSSQDTKPLLT
ncbi:solute carrier family 15 member 4-like isoform X2 [Oratosquilla oratoria]|uniref:solute carrier family 15 member 4-like isoform X2 n=2 Tax=Oratosquilla oratoria TaxID=337810 RepID=UPI003F767188